MNVQCTCTFQNAIWRYIWVILLCGNLDKSMIAQYQEKQARKPRSYASRNYHPPTRSLTGVKCRATSVAKKFLVWMRRLSVFRIAMKAHRLLWFRCWSSFEQYLCENLKTTWKKDWLDWLITMARISSCWVSWNFNGALGSVDNICNPWIDPAGQMDTVSHGLKSVGRSAERRPNQTGWNWRHLVSVLVLCSSSHRPARVAQRIMVRGVWIIRNYRPAAATGSLRQR